MDNTGVNSLAEISRVLEEHIPDDEFRYQTEVAMVNTSMLELKSEASGYKARVRRLEDVTQNLRIIDTNFLQEFDEHFKTVSASAPGAEKKLEELKWKKMENMKTHISRVTAGAVKLVTEFDTSVKSLGTLVHEILYVQLRGWKRSQLALLDVPDDPKKEEKSGSSNKEGVKPGRPGKTERLQKLAEHLTQIQRWCEGMVDIIQDNIALLRSVETIHSVLVTMQRATVPCNDLGAKLPQLRAELGQIFDVLVSESFVVTGQPAQVVKKTNKTGKLSAHVQLLVGGKLNFQMNPPTVTVSMITEEAASQLVRKEECSGGETIVMVNHQTAFDSNCIANFRHLSFTQPDKTPKSSGEAGKLVPEKKYCLKFEATLNVADQTIKKICVLSVPIVPTVHQNQEAQAKCTIFWDNEFSERQRLPFQVPDKVSWSTFAQGLSNYFAAKTGRGLAGRNLVYLREKYFEYYPTADSSVEWKTLFKKAIPGKEFTYWEWVYGILKLTMERLTPLWKDGLIEGFISKSNAETCLTECSLGTFLLRFSESMKHNVQKNVNAPKNVPCIWKAGISIAWVGYNQVNVIMAQHLRVFFHDDLEAKHLSNRVLDFPHISCLYPNLPKKDWFPRIAPEESKTPRTTQYVDFIEQITPVLGFQGENNGPVTAQSTPPPVPVSFGAASSLTYPQSPFQQQPESPGLWDQRGVASPASTVPCMSPAYASSVQSPAPSSSSTADLFRNLEECENPDVLEYLVNYLRMDQEVEMEVLSMDLGSLVNGSY